MNKIFLLFAFILTIVSCSQESDNVAGLISENTQLTLDSLELDSLSPINSSNNNTYTIAGSCLTEAGEIAIKVNTNEIETTAICTSNHFSKIIDMDSIADSNSVTVDISELTYTNSQTIIKDTVNPSVTSNIINDLTYSVDETVQISLNLSEAITVVGNPSIELLAESKSSSNIYAVYNTGSGTSTLQFNYIIKSGDGDSNGLDIAATINSIGATLLDSAGNELDLNLITTNFPSVLIDSQSPMITSFIEPANATYADGGGELLFQVNFSELVNITGSPRISINLGGTTVYADYKSGSGSTGLEFSYLVQSGDNDLDGITLNSNSIELNGGTINAADGDNSGLEFSSFIDSMASILVNTSSGITAPNSVTGVSTAPTTTNTSLAVSWSIPSNNGTAIINYAVQYRQQGQSSWITVNPAPTTSATVIAGLTAAITYEVRVAANNGLLGGYSSVSTAEIFDIISLNPIAWLSATNITNGGSEPSDGEKIGNWADLTGAATDATESNTANQPTYKTNVQNGLPAVYFDGTLAKGLEGTFVRTNNAGLTIILVGKFNNTARRAFFEFYRVGGGARGFFFTYGYQASSSKGLDNTQFNVWSAYDTGTQSTLWENGVNKYTNMNNYSGFPSTAFTGNGAYVLGDDQTGGDQLNGYIGEFLVFDRHLTTPELTTLQTYLKNKWGTP
jgi:hypothetical protein